MPLFVFFHYRVKATRPSGSEPHSNWGMEAFCDRCGTFRLEYNLNNGASQPQIVENASLFFAL